MNTTNSDVYWTYCIGNLKAEGSNLSLQVSLVINNVAFLCVDISTNENLLFEETKFSYVNMITLLQYTDI